MDLFQCYRYYYSVVFVSDHWAIIGLHLLCFNYTFSMTPGTNAKCMQAEKVNLIPARYLLNCNLLLIHNGISSFTIFSPLVQLMVLSEAESKFILIGNS